MTQQTRPPKTQDVFKPLRPFGDQWLALWQQYSDHLEGLSGEKLAELDRAVQTVSTTNIGWTHYEAAQILRDLIPDERRRRATP